jgi:hypothetical protein
MTNTRVHICPACNQPYGAIPPVGEPKQIMLPSGVPITPGKLSELRLDRAATPPTITPGFVDLFDVTQEDPAEELATPPLPSTPPAAQLPQQIQKFTQTPTQPAHKHDDPFTHETIGGRMTVCILMYGNFHDMHKRCMNNILSTTRAPTIQIRVACNEVCMETIQYLSRLKEQGRIYKVIVNQTNIKKYPAMRRMFHDPDDPITDKWVVWFDDDSMAERDPEWIDKLAHTIINAYPKNCHVYGAPFIWTFDRQQIEWVKSRPWYRNRPFQMKNGRETPNGNRIKFATGGFWAMSMAVIKAGDIPDEQIGNNGGDYMVGEQVWQQGYDLKAWNQSKQFVHTSSIKRRGLNEKHTGKAGWVPGGTA